MNVSKWKKVSILYLKTNSTKLLFLGALLTINEFQNCVNVFGFGTPSASIAQAFINEAEADGSISTKLEAYKAVD